MMHDKYQNQHNSKRRAIKFFGHFAFLKFIKDISIEPKAQAKRFRFAYTFHVLHYNIRLQGDSIQNVYFSILLVLSTTYLVRFWLYWNGTEAAKLLYYPNLLNEAISEPTRLVNLPRLVWVFWGFSIGIPRFRGYECTNTEDLFLKNRRSLFHILLVIIFLSVNSFKLVCRCNYMIWRQISVEIMEFLWYNIFCRTWKFRL